MRRLLCALTLLVWPPLLLFLLFLLLFLFLLLLALLFLLFLLFLLLLALLLAVPRPRLPNSPCKRGRGVGDAVRRAQQSSSRTDAKGQEPG
jgi:hypothetical protein